MSSPSFPDKPERFLRALRGGLFFLCGFGAAGAAAWAMGALYFDFPVLRNLVPWVFPGAVCAVLYLVSGRWKKLAGVLGLAGLVLAWWLTLQPRQDRLWQADVAQLPWAEINGDEVTLHNIRHCDHRVPGLFAPDPRRPPRICLRAITIPPAGTKQNEPKNQTEPTT